jgi:hypothetical protein
MFHPLDPQPDEIEIIDIAHALSMQCRFTGHTKDFYSVAQHSVYVSQECDPDDALWGLLHDATEAYMADVSRPVKKMPEMAAYKEAEARLMKAIAKRFHLRSEEPESVKIADTLLVDIEARDLMSPRSMKWEWDGSAIGTSNFHITRTWMPEEARERFLERFMKLSMTEARNAKPWGV